MTFAPIHCCSEQKSLARIWRASTVCDRILLDLFVPKAKHEQLSSGATQPCSHTGAAGFTATSGFLANLDRVNALAESSPGFIWRLKTDDGNAISLRPLDESTIVNISVWTDVTALNQFVYRSAHVEIMRRRKEWFERMSEAYVVLWWIKQGHIPSMDEALERLDHLRQHGPSVHAFTFRQPFPAPDETDAAGSTTLLVDCPA